MPLLRSAEEDAMTTRRSFLKFLGLSPAASLVPAETQARLREAAEAAAKEEEEFELDFYNGKIGDVELCWSTTLIDAPVLIRVKSVK